ncbi:transcription initiation protein [Sphingomonas sp.]|uniref:transcription initiation protein n=1 Tax=Sphingomonas sp. TaxID=28214 RepID=UPI0025E7E5E2|nr:transcription initiation protein [Sphingomonas sp.]
MTKYLISFPSEAMRLSEEEFRKAGIDARAVIDEAKASGVYVFGGGINEGVAPALVSADGSVRPVQALRSSGTRTVFEWPRKSAAPKWFQITANSSYRRECHHN